MKVVIDHVSGSRRGQRQELIDLDRVTFGRHPSCAVSFDAHRDLDASSQHAELRIGDDGISLVDVGSSNGTFVGGAKVVEKRIELRTPVVVEFGPGGPQVSIWVGRPDDPVPESPARRRPGRSLWIAAVLGAVALAVAVGILLKVVD